MVRREVMDGEPSTKYAPHATHNERRAGRRDIPPLMTSQALTISARHTSSTVPTIPRHRHSLRDNEWRAIARALIVEVRRPFLSHHSTCQSIALGAGAILTLYPFTLDRAHHGAQPWDIGYPYVQRLTKRRLGPPRPSRITRSRARPLHPPRGNPQPLRDATARSSRARQPERATDGKTNDDLRPRAQALCARNTTCEHGRVHRAP